MLNEEQNDKIKKLVEHISVQLEESGNKLFAKKPTAYIFLSKDLFLISLLDENKNEVTVTIAKKPKKGIFNFFISRFVIDDFLSPDGSNASEFARDKVAGYLEEVREDAAYSANLKRSRILSDYGLYFASIVFLISAFETAMKDIFFRSNELWFFRLDTPSEELLDKFGTKLTGEEMKSFRIKINMGDEEWGFTGEEHNQMQTWQNILYRTSVFRICKQLGILDDYLLLIHSNLLREIGSYEILKRTLELQGTRCAINFQMIDGKGGIRWSFGKFIGIDFKTVEKDLQVIKKATTVRHKIIHGFLDEKSINETYVKVVEESVTRVVAYVKNEILEWSYVI